MDCNPNTIEILGCKPEHYLYIHPLGQRVLDNKKNFLNIKAIDTFGGYARAQYNRLEHALLGNSADTEKKINMMKHSMQCALDSFNVKHKHTRANIIIRELSKEEYIEIMKAIKDWRFWVLLAQGIVCILLLFCEPTEQQSAAKVVMLMLATKAGAIMLFAAIAAEWDKWKERLN
jgi:hypothetical protein